MASHTIKAEFKESRAPLKTIEEIQFGLFSPEDVKAFSVVHIQYPETMDDSKQRPREGGLADPRMGTMDRNTICATCEEDQKHCPGHFGHIELAVDIFHFGMHDLILANR
jgi:DNA-directed RNA polymerase II subunit RPB1